MKSKAVFSPLDGNLGGRTTIKKQIVNHHIALIKAKPTINTREPPKPHVDSKKRYQEKEMLKEKKQGQIHENFYALKKVVNIKGGYVDKSKPKSFGILKKSGPPGKKQRDFINFEHELNLKSQQKRISQIGQLPHERAKNEFDPITHPPIIFSRPQTSQKKSADDDSMFYRGNPAKRVASTAAMNGLKNKVMKKPQSESQFGESMQSFPSPMKRIELSPSKIPYDVPKIFSDSEHDLDKVKERLIDILVDHQLYKKQDLEDLFENLKAKNPHIEENKLRKIVDEIDDEFND